MSSYYYGRSLQSKVTSDSSGKLYGFWLVCYDRSMNLDTESIVAKQGFSRTCSLRLVGKREISWLYTPAFYNRTYLNRQSTFKDW